MARKMKTVHPPRPQGDTLVITVDPLKVARGRRVLPRGGTHGSGKHLSRAQHGRQWRRQVEEGRRGVA
jgi:hypothetical protein